jgi:hypothetical protein
VDVRCAQVLIPGILTTLLSFAVFWTDTGSADALGYGIGVIVVNLLSTVVLMGILPVCGEVIWIEIFAFINTAFCCISLFQSAFNIMLENLQCDTLVPGWVILTNAWLRSLLRKSRVEPAVDHVSEARKTLTSASLLFESVAGVVFRQQSAMLAASSGKSLCPRRKGNLQIISDTDPTVQVERLVFFEHLFFTLDPGREGFVDEETVDMFFSYTVLDLDPAERKASFEAHDVNQDKRLNRVEFVSMCVEELWQMPIELIKAAMENLAEARDARAKRNAARWTDVAEQMDLNARYVIPAMYFLALIVTFNLELSDEYGVDGTAEMFSGLGSTSLTTGGIVTTVLYIVVAGLLAWSSSVSTRCQPLPLEHRPRPNSHPGSPTGIDCHTLL